ncbi:MAG: OsmC family protein [Halobacteriota archaeon]|nr:OsmC family protein [Halobacteriota archaeon]
MHKYETKVIWSEGRFGELSANETEMKCSPPINFRGYSKTMTPEHAFVASAEICILMTFLTMAEKNGVGLVSYESETEGMLEKMEKGYEFTKIIIRPKVRVKVEEDINKAKEAMVRAKKYALVLNSMKTEVVVEPNFETTNC